MIAFTLDSAVYKGLLNTGSTPEMFVCECHYLTLTFLAISGRGRQAQDQQAAQGWWKALKEAMRQADNIELLPRI